MKLLTNLLLLLKLCGALLSSLLLALALLQESLGNENLVVSWHASILWISLMSTKYTKRAPIVRIAATARHSRLKADSKT